MVTAPRPTRPSGRVFTGRAPVNISARPLARGGPRKHEASIRDRIRGKGLDVHVLLTGRYDWVKVIILYFLFSISHLTNMLHIDRCRKLHMVA